MGSIDEGGGEPSNSGGGNCKEVSSPRVEQVSQGAADISLGGSGNDGDWEVFIRKAKNKAGNSAAKPWGSQNSISKLNDYIAPQYNDEDEEDGGPEGSSDELLSDDYDSDESQKSHETRKKNQWFKAFFEKLDSLTLEEINKPGRHWHCPACQNGPGSIDWFRGLQPLVTHAKTKGSRVNIHREFAELLEEEFHRRGISVTPTPDHGSRAAETSSLLICKNAALVALANQMQTRLDLMESSFHAERESLQRKLDWWESSHPDEHYPGN